jgi:hypothetical protein
MERLGMMPWMKPPMKKGDSSRASTIACSGGIENRFSAGS